MSQDQVDKLRAKLAKDGIEIGRASEIKTRQEYVSTGSLLLNDAIGVPGYPCGRIVELSGPESSGKSLLTLVAESIVTRQGKYVFRWDGEDDLSSAEANQWRSVFGIDPKFVIQQPKCSGEKLIDAVTEVVREMKDSLKLIVIDSLGSIIPGKSLDRAGGDTLPGKSAQLKKELLQRLTIENRYAAVLVVNHLTSKFGYGADTVTGGGWGPRFYSAVRLSVKGNPILGSDSDTAGAIGQEIDVVVKKNKVGPPRKTAKLKFLRELGTFDILSEITILAVEKGLVRKKPPWYYLGDKTFKGEESFREYLGSNKKVLSVLIKKVCKVDPSELLE